MRVWSADAGGMPAPATGSPNMPMQLTAFGARDRWVFMIACVARLGRS